MMIGTAKWTTRQWMVVTLVAVCVWALFAFIGPGSDFIRCYTDMVLRPERLKEVAIYPWTVNPPYLAVFMAPFITLPGRAGYILFVGLTIASYVCGAYLLGGKPILVILSAHMMWVLWWGQLEGWGILGVILGWSALQRKSWPLMFLALTLASFKPQISAVPVIAMWWWLGNPGRWKAAAAMLALFLASIWIWGPWPLWYYQGIFEYVGDGHFGPWNASLGLYALPVFLPALLLPLDREKRLIALTASFYIASPYQPYYSTLPLLCFAVPWWAYLNLIYIPFYLPTNEPRYQYEDSVLFQEIQSMLKLVNPHFYENWVKEKFIFRDPHAQAICTTGFAELIPDVLSPIRNLFVSDSTQFYPEDRTISAAIRQGRKAANRVIQHLESDLKIK